ncbi:MAG: tRNA (adenosine(37)-N6)-threonylcarbamoyltransferase complex ATPase subunit type 1 TsaE [Gammaproteobacteria bacterium]|nr:tRNA (adenosine(37)-N6)-threonylcarbamoyltransferase complex ATPase subunit type 1 TsaE [Gammaproteobacteria bacterium]MCY4228703.1 tRNA (adenosine(37)-N6)-threonylcarbamoyltransferase complex ATPase subunit type 1 TsaE [Gammaproteobacteria bacterium]
MLALSHRIDDESSMLAFGEALSGKIEPGEVVYLIGELGAGKTTLARGILSGLGYQENVVSPTYTLIEPYAASDHDIYHLDLYRLNSEDEIENLGLRDLLDGNAVCLIEWPDKFTTSLPSPSLTIHIEVFSQGRSISLDPDLISDR